MAFHIAPSPLNSASTTVGRKLRTACPAGEKNHQCNKRGSSMRARTRTGQSSKGANSIPLFFDEDMVSIPPERILDEFRRLSRFLPVIVLIPKSAICENTAKSDLTLNKFVTAINA